MRHGRVKAARKTLRFFQLHAGIKPPYNVLLDGTFLVAAVRQKFKLKERVEKVLQGNCVLHVIRAALNELDQFSGTSFEQAKQIGLDECDIIENESLPHIVGLDGAEHQMEQDTSKITASEAIFRLLAATSISEPKRKRAGERSLSSNPKKFFLATQDKELAGRIRTKVPNVPLLHISQSVLLLEAPSLSSKKSAENDERSKQSAGNIMTTQEMELIKNVKKQESSKIVALTSYRVKQKAKEPNPLSCKKRKTQETHAIKATDSAILPPKKRKRSKKATASVEHT